MSLSIGSLKKSNGNSKKKPVTWWDLAWSEAAWGREIVALWHLASLRGLERWAGVSCGFSPFAFRPIGLNWGLLYGIRGIGREQATDPWSSWSGIWSSGWHMDVGLPFDGLLRGEEQWGRRKPRSYLTHHKRKDSQPLVLMHKLCSDPLAKQRSVPAVSGETSPRRHVKSPWRRRRIAWKSGCSPGSASKEHKMSCKLFLISQAGGDWR